MKPADRRLAIGGLISLLLTGGVISLLVAAQNYLMNWYVFLIGPPFVSAGLSMLILAGARTMLVRYGIGHDAATIAIGVAMILQLIAVRAFPLPYAFLIEFLSWGVAFCGVVACMIVIIPALRGLREMHTPPRNAARSDHKATD